MLYREFDDVDLPSFLNFAFGCVLSGAGELVNPRLLAQADSVHLAKGVYLLTRSPASPSSPSTPTSSKPPTSLDPTDSSRPLLLVPSPPPHLHARARKLSLTLGGTQYLLAHSPAKSSRSIGGRSRGRAGGDSSEEEEIAEAEEEDELEGDQRV